MSCDPAYALFGMFIIHRPVLSMIGVRIQDHWQCHCLQRICNLLFIFHSNPASIFYCFGDMASYWIFVHCQKLQIFPTSRIVGPPLGFVPKELQITTVICIDEPVIDFHLTSSRSRSPRSLASEN